MNDFVTQTKLFVFDFIASLPKDRKIIFISREGIFLKKIYDLFCCANNIKNNSVHFCISRGALALGLAQIPGGIRLVLEQPSAEKDFLRMTSERLKIPYSIIKKIEENSSNKLDFQNNIFKYIKCENVNPMARYVESFNFKNDDVIVDIGYRGFIQYGLELMTDLKFEGRYICFLKNVFPINGKSFLHGSDVKKFFKNRLFFEVLMNGNGYSLSEVVSDEFSDFKFVYKENVDSLPVDILKIREDILDSSRNSCLDMKYLQKWNGNIFDFSSIVDLKKTRVFLEDEFGGAKKRNLIYA